MPRRKKAEFYAMPLTDKEFGRFKDGLSQDELKRALIRATVGERPTDTNHFLFIKSTPDALFCFVISKQKEKKRNRFYVLDAPGGFTGELFERMRATYPQEYSNTLLDLGVRDELNELLAHAGLVEVVPLDKKQPELDIASFYEKQVRGYVQDMSKPVKEAQLQQLVAKKRSQLVRRYVEDMSLPLTGVSKKNRPIILRARQARQRQLMGAQDQNRVLPRQVQKSLKNNPNSADGLAYDLLWLPLDMVDPLLLEPIEDPVLLPTGTLIDKRSVQDVRAFGRDPLKNTEIKQIKQMKLSVSKPIKRVIDALAREAGAIVGDKSRPMQDKALALLRLRESYQQTLQK